MGLLRVQPNSGNLRDLSVCSPEWRPIQGWLRWIACFDELALSSFRWGISPLYAQVCDHQRLDRPSCPVCGLIYTEILISPDAQRALNNAQISAAPGLSVINAHLLVDCLLGLLINIGSTCAVKLGLKGEEKAVFYFTKRCCLYGQQDT